MYFEGLAQLESGGEQLLGRVLSLAGQQRRELRREPLDAACPLRQLGRQVHPVHTVPFSHCLLAKWMQADPGSPRE